MHDAQRDAGGTTNEPAPGSGNDEETPERIGPYRIHGVLGRGGMGLVYHAQQTDPIDRPVAVKVIKRGMDSDRVVARFRAEQQALAMMDHPGIATVLDAGITHDGRPYFAMELVHGVPLTEYCDGHRLPMNDRLRLMIDVCNAVQHAHYKGVIHRDLKPTNILVSTRSGRPQAKVIDFGIAKAMTPSDDDGLTRLGTAVGTPSYMSPEQASGGMDVDSRTDVYALGVLLYELLVGARPDREADVPTRPSSRFSSVDDSWITVADKRQTQPAILRRALAGDLDWIALRAIAQDREERYATPSELATELERYIRGEPVKAHPPSAAYRASRWIRRNRGTFATGVAAAVAVIAGAGFGTMGFMESRRAEQDARAEAETARRISDFLTGLFEVSDPGEARGNSITAREILDRGAASIEEGLEDQPIVRAGLMNTMGTVYNSLGLYDDSERLLTAALDVRRDILDPPHDDLVESLRNLGILRKTLGEAESADTLYREALEMAGARGERSLLTAEVMSDLGELLASTGDMEEAERLHTTALEIKRELEEPPSHTLAVSLNNLGNLFHNTGRFEEADTLYRESFDMLKALYGDDHPMVATVANNMAELYKEVSDFESAEPLLLQVLETRRRLLGNHHRVAGSLNNLASLYHDLRRYDEAEPLYREAIALYRTVLGEEHALVATAMNNLAMLHADQGQYDEGERLYLESLAIRRKALGDGHPMVATSLANLGTLKAAAGEAEAAEAYLRESIALSRQTLGRHPNVARGLHQLARLLQANQDPAGAEAALREAVEIRREAYGNQNPELASSLSNLGNVLNTLSRSEEAATVLEESLAIREEVLPEGHPAIAISRNNLAGALRTLGRLDEAEIHYRAALDGFRENYGDRHVNVGIALTNLASTLTLRGVDLAEAEDRAREALEIVSASFPSGHWRVAVAESVLGGVLAGRGRVEEAEPLVARAYETLLATRGPNDRSTIDAHDRLRAVRAR